MRHAILLYGILSYAIGLGGLLYFILFLSAWRLVPHNMFVAQVADVPRALLLNTLLILLFALHHSIMARASFKQRLCAIVSPAIERSSYVLCSGILLFLLCWYWRAMPGVVWELENAVVFNLLCIIQMLGWVLVVLSSFLINHFELFGLQQVYYRYKNESPPRPVFTDRLFYKVVRHPLQLGILIGIWSTPVLTTGYLYLAACFTAYIFVGLYFEEKDLLRVLGDDYRQYQTRVRKLLPLPRRA